MPGVHFVSFRPSYRQVEQGITATPKLFEDAGAKNLSSGISTFAPGSTARVHGHNTEEVLTILQGKALIEAEGKRFEAEPLDICYMPAGVFHRVTNIGDSEMRLLWIYGSTRPVRILGDGAAWKVAGR
ncbi:MAG: cupin domain-containing protein [Acidobacteria bacterium]|nr:cupin domain-containing protein [Acidobacteriota bacterium]